MSFLWFLFCATRSVELNCFFYSPFWISQSSNSRDASKKLYAEYNVEWNLIHKINIMFKYSQGVSIMAQFPVWSVFVACCLLLVVIIILSNDNSKLLSFLISLYCRLQAVFVFPDSDNWGKLSEVVLVLFRAVDEVQVFWRCVSMHVHYLKYLTNNWNNKLGFFLERKPTY